MGVGVYPGTDSHVGTVGTVKLSAAQCRQPQRHRTPAWSKVGTGSEPTRNNMQKIYDVILADPPWFFRNYSKDDPHKVNIKGRGQQRHYPTMTESEICAMQIPASKNATLFLWTTWTFMPQALRVIEAWGFQYKTLAWIWVKSNKSGNGFFTGMGYYTRANSEPCLLATRGVPLKVSDRGVLSVIYAPVREHSRKPDEQYSKIERLYPLVKYPDRLELFARRQQPGWDVFGNQVEDSINIKST